jgi:aspartate racemase
MSATVPRCLGILGGTGPAASAHAHALLVAAAQRDYAAAADMDFPALLVFNTPLPATSCRGWRKEDSEHVRTALLAAARTLVSAGAQLIVPACNSIDVFAPDINADVDVTLLSLPALIAGEIAKQQRGRVGVLSSRLARDLGLHAQALSALGVATISTTASEQDRVDNLIERLMRAPVNASTRAELLRLGVGFFARGAEAVIIGCTELSLCAPANEDWIDGTILAVDAALRFAYTREREELRACA